MIDVEERVRVALRALADATDTAAQRSAVPARARNGVVERPIRRRSRLVIASCAAAVVVAVVGLASVRSFHHDAPSVGSIGAGTVPGAAIPNPSTSAASSTTTVATAVAPATASPGNTASVEGAPLGLTGTLPDGLRIWDVNVFTATIARPVG